MRKNIGKSDKMIRIILAIILAALDFFEVVKGGFSWILSVLAIILFVTALVNFCPVYTLLGMNTCKLDNE